MRRRVVVTTLSLLIAGVLSVALTLGTNSPHDDGAVTGHLLISGGPAPGTARPSAGEVTARNANGQSFSISVPATGKFTFQLPAGKYSLTGSSPQFGNGQYRCSAQRTVTVPKDATASENVYCSEM